jgi:hypothetical protein
MLDEACGSTFKSAHAGVSFLAPALVGQLKSNNECGQVKLQYRGEAMYACNGIRLQLMMMERRPSYEVHSGPALLSMVRAKLLSVSECMDALSVGG